MPPRSQLKTTLDRIYTLIEDFQTLSEDEQKFFLDTIDPLPDEAGQPVKKTRKKRKATAPTNSTSKKKSGLPDTSLSGKADGADDGKDANACAQCPHPPDDIIHHQADLALYHEFNPQSKEI